MIGFFVLFQLFTVCFLPFKYTRNIPRHLSFFVYSPKPLKVPYTNVPRYTVYIQILFRHGHSQSVIITSYV